MPRSKAILQSDYPYSITARCINREWFNISMNRVWDIFCEELTYVHKIHNLNIHSFVLMSNHFHLIASTPEANISQAMQQFMHRSSRALTKEGNRINQTFAGRHYKCILNSESYYLSAYKYNYRNPVTAGICTFVEDYPYSTLQMNLGLSDQKIPLVFDTLLNEDPRGILQWLNTIPDPEKLEAVQWGLKRPYFKSKKSTITNRRVLEPTDTL